MKANALFGAYQEDFNTTAMANQIKLSSFDNLPWKGDKLIIGDGEALYLYGDHKALVKELAQLNENNTIDTDDRFYGLALFRVTRTVGKVVKKKKQLLMVTRVEHHVPKSLRLAHVLMFDKIEGEQRISVREFKKKISALVV